MSASDYCFTMAPSQPNLLLREAISMDFSPLQINNQNIEIYPRFNLDNNHQTPSFVIPLDIFLIPNYAEVAEIFFAKRTAETLESKTVSQMPQKENSKSGQSCGVCKVKYSNYHGHVNSRSHKKRVTLSKFNLEIHSLCTLYTPQTSHTPIRKFIRKTSRRSRTAGVRKTNDSTSIGQDLFASANNSQEFSFKEENLLITDQLVELKEKELRTMVSRNLSFVFLEETPIINKLFV